MPAEKEVKYGALFLLGETVQQEKQTASLPDGQQSAFVF